MWGGVVRIKEKLVCAVGYPSTSLFHHHHHLTTPPSPPPSPSPPHPPQNFKYSGFQTETLASIYFFRFDAGSLILCIGAVTGSKQVFLTVHMHLSQASDLPKHIHQLLVCSIVCGQKDNELFKERAQIK